MFKSGSIADSDSKIFRQTGVQVFGTGADPESVFCDSAYLCFVYTAALNLLNAYTKQTKTTSTLNVE